MTLNIGEAIDVLYDLKQQKAELSKQIATIDEQYDIIEQDVLAQLQAQGMVTAKAHTASATVSSSIVPNITDWEEFAQYIIDSRQVFLLERRPSVTVYRDLLNAGETIPGTEPFTKTKLALRKNR